MGPALFSGVVAETNKHANQKQAGTAGLKRGCFVAGEQTTRRKGDCGFRAPRWAAHSYRTRADGPFRPPDCCSGPKQAPPLEVSAVAGERSAVKRTLAFTPEQIYVGNEIILP